MSKSSSEDAGFTLVELVLYVILSVLVLTVMFWIFLNSSQSQSATKNRDSAAGAAQVVANSLETGIRNSSDFTITGTLLRARVAQGSSSDWKCQAWALTPTKDLVTTTAMSAIAVPTNYTGWTVLAGGVAGALSGGTVFSAAGTDRLQYGFSVSSGSGSTTASVPLQGGVVAQAKGNGIPTSCW